MYFPLDKDDVAEIKQKTDGEFGFQFNVNCAIDADARQVTNS